MLVFTICYLDQCAATLTADIASDKTAPWFFVASLYGLLILLGLLAEASSLTLPKGFEFPKSLA